MEGSRRVAVSLLLALGTLACPKKAPEVAAPTAHEPTSAERAVTLYDQGRYDEAKPILQSLEAGGQLTGPLMYRLGFCHGYAGDASAQAEWMQKAVVKLGEEAAAADNLEVSFFLANAQTNVGRPDDAKKTAAAATSRIESKAWPAPRNGLEKFRVAKLYADQGRTDQAVSWYREAVRSFESEKVEAPGYVRWARRYLAQESFAKSDFVEAEKSYAALASMGGASAADFDRLASASARVGKYEAAAAAWNDAVRLDPANADRARYSRNLALLAQDVPALPASSPGGKPWGELTKEELEALLKDQAATARDLRGQVDPAASTSPQARADVEQKLRTAEASFVAAGLEYTLRNLDIRETAFVGGYAPMIFHAEEWHLPPVEDPAAPQN